MKESAGKKHLKTGLYGLFLFLATEIVAADIGDGTNDPKLLFDKMLAAQKSIQYQGAIAFERGDQLISYHLDSQANTHFLKTLNGPNQTLQVPPLESCVERVEYSAEVISNWYNFSYTGAARIAAREGHEIALRPVDPYRLGYSFVVDQETGLMLKSVATLPDRRALERMQFIDISIDMDTSKRSNETIEHSEPCSDQTVDKFWRLEWVPEGFQQIKTSAEGQRSSFLFGDGLSTFSIFIQPVDNLKFPVGNTQQGATTLLINYFSADSLTFMVTFVGEVPIEAAERILTNIGTR